jgi:RimJ/RimL family protein N-acetyltransferase
LLGKGDTTHIAHRKVLTFIKDAKIIKNAFGVIDKRKPSESRVKAIAEQDQQIAQMTQQAAAHHAKNRMPMSLTQQQRATIKSRKKVYGYHIKNGWGIHDKTEAVYPAREFYNTVAKPGKDPRRQVHKAFLPGGVAKPLSAMTGAERKTWKAGVKGGNLSRSLKGITQKDSEAKDAITGQQHALKSIPESMKTTQKHAGGKVHLVRSKDVGVPTSWAPGGSKGGQRRNKGYVFHGQMPVQRTPWTPPQLETMPKSQAKEYMKHELTHANRRKPMSAMVRFHKKPEKLWGDEARADSVMNKETRKQSGYLQVADSDKEGRRRMMATRPAHYQTETGPDRYKEVAQKLGSYNKSPHAIKNGKQKSNVTDINSKKKYWNTDRKIAAAETGVATTAAAGTVAGVVYSQKKEKARRADAHRRAAATRAQNKVSKKATLERREDWKGPGERWNIKDEQGKTVGDTGTYPKRFGMKAHFGHEDEGLKRWDHGGVGDSTVSPKYRSKGYATDARIARTQQSKHKKIYSSIDTTNIASIKSAEKAGGKPIRVHTRKDGVNRVVYLHKKVDNTSAETS